MKPLQLLQLIRIQDDAVHSDNFHGNFTGSGHQRNRANCWQTVGCQNGNFVPSIIQVAGRSFITTGADELEIQLVNIADLLEEGN